MRLQISIAGLMRLVLVCGCGLAALRYASPILAQACAAFIAAALLTATVGAIKGRSRTAWLGFAIFGWGFTALAWGFAMHEAVSNQPVSVRWLAATPNSPHTPFTPLLENFYEHFHYAPIAPPINWSSTLPNKGVPSGPVFESFQWIGHDLACLFFGLIGSAVALFMEARSKQHPCARVYPPPA